MTITLDPVTEERLQSEMRRGGYASAEDLIRAALDVMQETDGDVDAWKGAFIETLNQRWANVEHGAFYSAEEAKAKLSELRTTPLK